MIAQEKEEHNKKNLSSKNQSKDIFDEKNDQDEASNEDCPLLGQPARSDKGEGGRQGGGLAEDWSEDVLKALDLYSELDLLRKKNKSLSHQIEVYKLIEQDRLHESEVYRLRLISEDLKEQERINSQEKTPLLLTRGVQSELNFPKKQENQKTIIDWLTFTADETTEILTQFVNIIIPGCTFINGEKGTQGYKKIILISLNGENLGRIGFMGTSPKNMLCLTGNGTEKVKDWNEYTYWLSLLKDFSISQIHLALDDYEGKFLSHDIFMKAYSEKKFKSPKARVNPNIERKEFTTGNGINKGRTRNVGKSKGCSKSCTGYEKGLEQFFQLFGKLPENEIEILIPLLTLNEINVDKKEINLDTSIYNWYRAEVKFHNNDVILPIDIILDRDKYYAGAYPFCEEILPMIEKKIPKRLPNNLEIALEEMFLNVGNSYGSSLFTALSIAKNDGKDLTEECVNIVKKIIKNHSKLNQKIIKEGALNHVKPFDPKELEVKKTP